jgi:hypothetical protein
MSFAQSRMPLLALGAQRISGRKIMANDPEAGRTELSTSEARAGRIVKGGAIGRILVVSLALTVAALGILYLLMI